MPARGGEIAVWPNSKGRLSKADSILESAPKIAHDSPTQRSCHKEAERLLLWALLKRGQALSSLNVEDAMAYAGFLQSPQRPGAARGNRQRWSPLWRPLEGLLSAAAFYLRRLNFDPQADATRVV